MQTPETVLGCQWEHAFAVLPSIAEKGTEGCKDLMEDFAACVKNVAKGTSWVSCNLKCKDLTLLSTIQKYLHVKPFTQKPWIINLFLNFPPSTTFLFQVHCTESSKFPAFPLCTAVDG